MRRNLTVWTIATLLVLGLAVPSHAYEAASQEGAAQAVGLEAPLDPAGADRRYEAYGFLFEQYDGTRGRYGRFSDREIELLGRVIMAYADLVGGPQSLKALVNGPVRVRRDLQATVSYTQAGQVIGLGLGAFDLALTQESNFYTWGARSGDELAQIVFGHEIGHRWIAALRSRAATDWAKAYGRNVPRGERASGSETWAAQAGSDSVEPEEEAVTNLALFALGKGYRWTFLSDAPATASRQMWIDGWVYDVMANS